MKIFVFSPLGVFFSTFDFTVLTPPRNRDACGIACNMLTLLTNWISQGIEEYSEVFLAFGRDKYQLVYPYCSKFAYLDKSLQSLSLDGGWAIAQVKFRGISSNSLLLIGRYRKATASCR